jgi:adenine-specific DNA-methyltransferase
MATDERHLREYTSDWAARLGLLPIPLFSDDGMDRSVLLNGSSGNFCLDTTADREPDHRARAWSANVGHYIRIVGDQVEIQRWDNTISEYERHPLSLVSQDLERFHSYLVSKEPPAQLAVIPHVVRVFRQIRNREELTGGADSLKVLLLLLACAASSTDRSRINASEWAVPQGAAELSECIDDAEWQILVETLLNPIGSDLRLNPDLLIRHAAGPVFQEAHREATLVDAAQMPLPGFGRRAADIQHPELGVGVHFTPPPLARSVVEQALAVAGTRRDFTILDPACGSGEFLREALRQIRLTGSNARIKMIGWDISATACDMATFLLSWEKKRDLGSVQFEINQRDSLQEQWPTDVNLLLMNPPFVSYEQLTTEQRGSVQNVMGNLARGRMEYSNAFIYKALESLQPDAVLGAIIPSSFYESSAAAQLREWVKGRLSPWLLARLGSQVLFPDAIVDAGLLIGKTNGGSAKSLLCFWADHRTKSTAEGLRYLRKATSAGRPRQSILVEGQGFSIYPAPELLQNSKSWSPMRYSAWSFARKLQHLPIAGDLFSIHTGARSGLLKAFLLPKGKWAALPKKEQKYFRPAVVNESIESGRLSDVVYAFYPHGQFSFDSENQLRAQLPIFYKTHLREYRASLQGRESTAPEGKWWEMHRPRTWQQISVPKLVSVQYGDVGAFGWDARGDFVVAGGYAWLPRSPLKGTGRFPLKLGLSYLALLNSPVFFELVASNSRKVRGGQWDLGNKYLERVPLPNLPSTGSAILEALFRVGSDIQSGNPIDWDSLANLARKAYGVYEEAP